MSEISGAESWPFPWLHPRREAFQAAGLTNVRRLGRRLEQLQRLSGAVQIERLGIDCDGVRWMVKGGSV
jgi:hypothetical protein